MESVRSWCPGCGPSGLAVAWEPAPSLEPEQAVLASCVTAVAQAICLANPEADPTRLDRRLATAWLVCRDLLTMLDLPDRAGDYSEGGVEEMKKAFTERGWSGPAAEGLVEELVKLLLRAVQEVRVKNFDTAVDIIIELEDKANKNFNTIRPISQRMIFIKFLLFAFLFRACYSEGSSIFRPLASLGRAQKDDIHTFLRSRVRALLDTVRRKSTIFSSSIKIKHQESINDLLRLVYPFYSVARGWSAPHRLVSDEGPEERVDLQIDPVLIPASEDRAVLLPLGQVLLHGEELAALHVFLWRDEKHLFLRRQEKVFRFVVTHGGPNSVLHIQLTRDRIKSKNTLHPTLVSSELPRKLLPTEKLLKDAAAPVPTIAVYREMAALGPVQLQALGIRVNAQDEQGRGPLHLAARRGRLEVAEFLLEAGARRHLRDQAGLHPLATLVLEAAGLDSEETAERLVQLLARGDSRLDLPDPAGRTVLHHASTLGSCSLRARLVTALVEAGAPLGSRDAGGDRPVDLAYRLTETTLFDTGG